MRIVLRGTPLSGRAYTEIHRPCPGNEWIHCRIRNDCFEGCGGPLELEEIIANFLDWAAMDEPVAMRTDDE